MEITRVDQKEAIHAIQNLEKLYTVVIGLTVAFLAVSYAAAQHLQPVHVLWLITLFVVVRDWLNITRDDFLGKSKPHNYIEIVYVLVLLSFALILRLIEGTALPVYVYIAAILVLTIVSLLDTLVSYKRVKSKLPPDKKLQAAGLITEDILTIVIYSIALAIAAVWLPSYPSWSSVIVIAGAAIVFETIIYKYLVRYLESLILKELLSTG